MSLIPLQVLANKGATGATASDLLALHDHWRSGGEIPEKTDDAWNGELVHTTIPAENADLFVVANQGDVLASDSNKVIARVRLGDAADERATPLYLERWRRWLALGNLLQFSGNARYFTTCEVALGSAPDLDLAITDSIPEEWEGILEAGPDPEKDGVARWRCVDLGSWRTLFR